MENRTYIAIDLKSFYASVECIERGLDPLTTNLVVADATRTEKTICLAVSPSLKRYGIPGRARLFEVVQKVKEANAERRNIAQGRNFSGKSHFSSDFYRLRTGKKTGKFRISRKESSHCNTIFFPNCFRGKDFFRNIKISGNGPIHKSGNLLLPFFRNGRLHPTVVFELIALPGK